MNRALVVTEDHKLICRDIADPRPQRYQAMVDILGCGICATTDREIIRGCQPFHSDYPCVLGHEAIGRVIEVGPGVRHLKRGNLVTRPAVILPGTSRDGLASAWGGFAQRGLVWDRRSLVEDGHVWAADHYVALRQNVVPADRPLRELVLGISLSETADWIGNIGPMRGKRVCIAGTGIAGLSMALWSKLAGATEVIVIGRRAARLEVARQVGADHTLTAGEDDLPEAVRTLTGGTGVDVFMEAVGKPDQINVGLGVVAPGGLVAVYGVPSGQRYELTFGAGPGDCRVAQFPACEHRAYPWVTTAMRRGWVPTDILMSHEWPFDQWERAFQQVADGEVVKGFLRMA